MKKSDCYLKLAAAVNVLRSAFIFCMWLIQKPLGKMVSFNKTLNYPSLIGVIITSLSFTTLTTRYISSSSIRFLYCRFSCVSRCCFESLLQYDYTYKLCSFVCVCQSNGCNHPNAFNLVICRNKLLFAIVVVVVVLF